MKKLLIPLATLFISTISAAQGLYVPRDVKAAIKKGTRATNGAPGINYWQNRARYNIHITAMPPDRNIKGSEEITYINNSPDTLTVLTFRLIQNIHKAGAPRLGTANTDYLTDGVHVDQFKINGVNTIWREPVYSPTVKNLQLTKPLLPHDSIQIQCDWHFQISLESGREGMIDSTTYFLAYYYPRIAVYDDYAGWDRVDHNDATEFYNDFNDYKLSVTVPKNYIVWATGDFQNPEEVLQPKYTERLKNSITSDRDIEIVTASDLLSKNITTPNPQNTWKYAYNNVSDMAIGLSDHFVWDAASVIVDQTTKRRASIQAAYNDTAKDFHHVVEFGQSSLSFLSTKWPGVAYPFPKMTVFQGYAGMEYPMMANDETYQDFDFARFVEEHEISHTWFPFYMGINETRYAFMDEGWATTFELLYNRSVMTKEKADQFYKQFRIEGWINDNNADEDLPIITPGENLSGRALGNNEYGKPSLGYFALKDMLGDELFRKCLHTFMERWHGKHPIPWDFFNTFNNISGQDLNWFWNSWYFSNNYIDLSLDKVSEKGGTYLADITNVGGFPVPVDLKYTLTDGSSITIHKTPEIWKNNLKHTTITFPSTKKITNVQLVTDIFLDADSTNNNYLVK